MARCIMHTPALLLSMQSTSYPSMHLVRAYHTATAVTKPETIFALMLRPLSAADDGADRVHSTASMGEGVHHL